jgi:8-oxo-dGTP pyrophosphatase MutT (NUDIX family)
MMTPRPSKLAMILEFERKNDDIILVSKRRNPGIFHTMATLKSGCWQHTFSAIAKASESRFFDLSNSNKSA